jgi:hypothetical protein
MGRIDKNLPEIRFAQISTTALTRMMSFVPRRGHVTAATAEIMILGRPSEGSQYLAAKSGTASTTDSHHGIARALLDQFRNDL